MAYTTAANVELAWSDITEAEVGVARLAAAIAYADSIIDASLNHRYTVPFSSTPTLIEYISTDFAAYICKYWKDPRMVTDPQTEMERQVAMAAGFLEQLKMGQMSIPGESQKQLVESTTEDFHSIFDLDDELEHVLDEDRSDDIEDRRD